MSLKRATVCEDVSTSDDLQIVRVRIEGTEESTLAYNYLALGCAITTGKQILVNTTGLDRNLGTGGVVFVVPDEAYEESLRYGHIVKLRYTPLQRAVDSVEEQGSPYHELLQHAESLEGLPVVCCELHSQMPLVAAAIKQEEPHASIVYIMTDVAALPMAFSRLVIQVREAGLIDTVISCGQAFGGDLDAINLYSALLAVHYVCEADVAIVAPGPGIVGSATAFGHGGTAQGEALNAVAVLEGIPVAPLRLSWEDSRERHRGLSHHSKIALTRVCLCRAQIPFPGNLAAAQQKVLMKQMEECGLNKAHDLIPVSYDFEAIDLRGVSVTTMGRSRAQDPTFFSAAFAAGIQAMSGIRTRRNTD